MVTEIVLEHPDPDKNTYQTLPLRRANPTHPSVRCGTCTHFRSKPEVNTFETINRQGDLSDVHYIDVRNYCGAPPLRVATDDSFLVPPTNRTVTAYNRCDAYQARHLRPVRP